jgi:low affinity Fe/Cu permease
MLSLSNGFDKLAHWTARHAGRPATFALALAVIVVWGLSGLVFQWSDTWQLIINTGTTIVTFLMVFLIQNTQNRDTEALQLKLDELIRVNGKARNRLLRLEELTEEEMEHIKTTFTRLAKASDPLTEERERTRSGNGSPILLNVGRRLALIPARRSFEPRARRPSVSATFGQSFLRVRVATWWRHKRPFEQASFG